MPDGFYLLYDPERYGWEPVWVVSGWFTRCGREYRSWCEDYMTGDRRWKRIDITNN
jgi:hypothetical protein